MWYSSIEVSDRQLAPSKAVNAACSSQPECISNPKTSTADKLMDPDLPQQPDYMGQHLHNAALIVQINYLY